MEPILAFGTERFPPNELASREDREQRTMIMLARALNLRTVVAFVGSGCSAPLGYPPWRQLVKQVVGKTVNECSLEHQSCPVIVETRRQSFAGLVTTAAIGASLTVSWKTSGRL